MLDLTHVVFHCFTEVIPLKLRLISLTLTETDLPRTDSIGFKECLQELNHFRSPNWFALISTRGKPLANIRLPEIREIFCKTNHSEIK